MAFIKGLGVQSTKMTGIQKAYAPDAPDGAMVSVVIVDDRVAKGEDGYETVVQIKRGELARRVLAALTGGRGSKIFRINDAALADAGKIRKSLFEAIFPEGADSKTTTIKKSEDDTSTKSADPGAKMRAAAKALDDLVAKQGDK